MDFSRLDDTKFPNLETASPYALKNTFDYTRWVPDTKIHLVNVLWNGDYSNVVKFDSDDARDKWFDSIEDSYTLTLKSNARIVPDGTVKLPLPYDVAARYNYLYVEIPLATSRERLIQNETENGIRRWYFFVGDVSYSAPNTTIISLSPDVWTNFICDTNISYMLLERGHAPVAKTDTDTYLNNPIANNKYLLAPDVNYDDSNVVKNSKYVPFGNGTKYVCFASTVSATQLKAGDTGYISSGSSFTSPTYSNTSDWYGYQLQVNNYTWGNGKNYSNVKAPVAYDNNPDGMVCNGLEVYAVPANNSGFLTSVRNQSPAFLRTIKAVFLVDESMVNIGERIGFCGHSIYLVTGKSSSNANVYPLDKSMFGFDSNAQRFAKLYTFPYSSLEVSDDSGNIAEVRIENTGTIGMQVLTSVAYPVLNWRVFLTGINGVGSQSYQWKNLTDKQVAKSVPNGDWDKLMFELDIPTYAIYMDSETAYMLDSYSSSVDNGRARALRDYHNAVRTANSGYVTGVAQADSARDNSKALASTAKTNADASANAAKTNSDNAATTLKTNTNNQANCNVNNINSTIATNSSNTQLAATEAAAMTVIKNARATADTALKNSVCIKTTSEENESSVATTTTSAMANIESGVVSGAVAGAGMGATVGTAAGPAGTAVGAVAGGLLGASTAMITAQAAQSNASIVAGANSAITSATTSANSSITSGAVQVANSNTELNNALAKNQTNNNNNNLGTQRDNNYNTTVTNANNQYNTTTDNAKRTCDTAINNATRNKDTANSNADRTRNTAADNAGKSREVAVLNAKETLETAQATAKASVSDSSRTSPIQLTQSSGNGANWAYGMNGIQFRLRTQSDSAIAQTATQFARFGYSLNQMWDVQSSGLTMMKNFTYWKARDIWVDVRNVASSEVGDLLSNMFRNGVTVWSDPDKIGKVGIYDN